MAKKIIPSLGEIELTQDFSSDAFEFLHQNFKKLIPKNAVVLDIGAHIGIFSVIFGSCATKVISFEPNPNIFNRLSENALKNKQLNIIPYPYACTSENKKYTFNYSDYNTNKDGTNGGFLSNLQRTDFLEIHPSQVEVDGVNLVDFLTNNHKSDIDNIEFIKIDTEGYDKEVIKTLYPIINKNRPLLMTEAFKYLTEAELEDYYNTINNLNYSIYDISPLDNINDCAGPLDINEFKYFTVKVCDNGNFLCVPNEKVKQYNLPEIVRNKTAVVVFGRNDGYKEPERFYVHIKTMLDTFDEVIYVDWNSDKQSFLYEIKDKLPKTNRLKHIVIPPTAANQLVNFDSKAQVCNSVLSFNIGIRRTDAEYIVLATTDIIPPSKETLQQFINKTNKYSFYTLSRRDIEYKDVIDNINNLEAYRRHLDLTVPPRYFPAKVTPNDNYSLFNCCGDFQFATKNIWLKIRGYEEEMLYACFCDTNVQKKAVLYGFQLVPVYDVPLYHMSHTGMANDGTSPSKQYYNDAMKWVEYFDKYQLHGHIMYSRNNETWGFSDIEIEHEII
jgi:FkbM family methyltransferase